MEFKVGDKVQCTSQLSGAARERYTVGKVYEVINGCNMSGQVLLTCDKGDDKASFLPENVNKFFKRISEPKQLTNVVLKQEQVVALDSLRKIFNDRELIGMHCNQNDDGWAKEYEVLDELDALQFAAALIVGYEAEQTPEEKVFKCWRRSVSTFNAALMKDGLGDTTAFENGYQNGIKATLNAYGITVKDIND